MSMGIQFLFFNLLSSAIAERLWSPESVTCVDAARKRLQQWRCLLSRRGVGVAPIGMAPARMAPEGPGSCAQLPMPKPHLPISSNPLPAGPGSGHTILYQ